MNFDLRAQSILVDDVSRRRQDAPMTGAALQRIRTAAVGGWISTALFLSSAVLLGCGQGKCEQLANRICDCEIDTSSQSSCRARVSQQSSGTKPSVEQEATCSTLLNTCLMPTSDANRCTQLLSQQGKLECGLSYAGPALP